MKFLLGYKINFVFSGRNVLLVWGGDKNLVGGFTKGNFSRWGWCVSFQLVTGPTHHPPTPPLPTTPLSPVGKAVCNELSNIVPVMLFLYGFMQTSRGKEIEKQ